MKWWIGNSDTDPLESPPDIERETGQGACKNCGSTREACDARVLKNPKRCCPVCKENGPALTHEKLK